MGDTVAAIATPLAQGSIGIIRISGDEALAVADRVFRPKSASARLSELKGYSAAYGDVYDGDEYIDDAVALVFRAPRSYTGEDVAELSLHGGPAVMRKALRAVFNAGAVQAPAGEFTKRAFLNGKMSLVQAEAVMDVISSESAGALQCAQAAKNGAGYRKITELCSRLKYCAASVAAFADFPDEGVQDMDNAELSAEMKSIHGELCKLIENYDSGRLIKNGIDCVIVGKPNVGKSTIMNILSDSERSIVTSVAGTTRDIVEETVEVNGIMLRLSDTAGIRDGGDEVEKIGISRALERMKNAQLIMAVFAADSELDSADIKLLESVKDVPTLIVVNKTDVRAAEDVSALERFGKVVCISAATGDGIDRLKSAIAECCSAFMLDPAQGYLANERQLNAAKAAESALKSAVDDLSSGQTLDAVGVLIEDAISALLSLSGENVNESVVDEVFSKFCVGK